MKSRKLRSKLLFTFELLHAVDAFVKLNSLRLSGIEWAKGHFSNDSGCASDNQSATRKHPTITSCFATLKYLTSFASSSKVFDCYKILSLSLFRLPKHPKNGSSTHHCCAWKPFILPCKGVWGWGYFTSVYLFFAIKPTPWQFTYAKLSTARIKVCSIKTRWIIIYLLLYPCPWLGVYKLPMTLVSGSHTDRLTMVNTYMCIMICVSKCPSWCQQSALVA